MQLPGVATYWRLELSCWRVEFQNIWTRIEVIKQYVPKEKHAKDVISTHLHIIYTPRDLSVA